MSTEEVIKLLKLQKEGKLSESEFAQTIQDLTKGNSHYFKEHVFQLLKELWYQSYHIIANMAEGEFKLEVALKLLSMIEIIYMNNAEKQFELYKEAEKSWQLSDDITF